MLGRVESIEEPSTVIPPILSRDTARPPAFRHPRAVLNGIVWKFRTGMARWDVPERYGSRATSPTRFRRWAENGTFERMFRAAPGQGRRGRGHRVAGVGRLHARPGPPARGRSARRGLRAPGRLRRAIRPGAGSGFTGA
ncbi:transposase [Streptomyces sp. NPDC014676]|uniref:transposase n=1 Tax=Streptomyces sp. NPDC014676 TaxID=3364879 RepID=UPI0036FFD913